MIWNSGWGCFNVFCFEEVFKDVGCDVFDVFMFDSGLGDVGVCVIVDEVVSK